MPDILPISLVLPTRNRADILKDILPLYLALPVSDIIIVDDASTDNTSEVLASFSSTQNIIVVRNQKRSFLPACRNIGISRASQPFILMGEDDVIMDSEYVSGLYEFLTSKPADIAAGRLIALRHGETKSQADQRTASKTDGGYLIPRTLAADISCRFDQPLETIFIHACSMFRKEWAINNPYDESYGGNALREESDFYLRCYEKGAKIFFLSNVTAYHMFHDYSGGCRDGYIWYAYHSILNNHRYLDRHWDTVKVLMNIRKPRLFLEISLSFNMIRMSFLFWLSANYPKLHQRLKSIAGIRQ